MPEGNPQFGELWQNLNASGTLIYGMVAEVASNVVTLVSFTGNRLRLPPERLGTPWTFVRGPLPLRVLCEAHGCGQLGAMQYEREGRMQHNCPRHLPSGVIATPTQVGVVAALPQPRTDASVGMQCPDCGQASPIEDARLSIGHVHFWHCQACNARWGSLTRLDVTGPLWLEVLHQNIRVFNLRLREHWSEIARIVVSPVIAERLPPDPNGSLANPRILTFPFSVRTLPPGLDVALAVQMAPRFEPRGGPGVVYAASEPEYVGRYTPQGEIPVGRVSDFRVGTQMTPEERGAATRAIPIPPYVDEGQQWVQRGTGDLLVVRMVVTDEMGQTMVRLGPAHDPAGTLLTMTMADFLERCSLFQSKAPLSLTDPVPIQVGEEWEHRATRDYASIRGIDLARHKVYIQMQDGKTRSVSLHEFTDTRWRKVTRRTAFERLLDDE